jgi:hypothetical protein
MNRKELDYFNLFYSIGAVLILFGVVSNIMHFKFQNFFLVLGLSMEMVIFAITSVKYRNKGEASQKGTSENELSEKNIQIGSDTFINIQTGPEQINKDIIRGSISTNDANGSSNLQSITLDINNGSNVPNYLNQKTKIYDSISSSNEISDLDSRSLVELENIDFISIKKDIFFHPALDSFDELMYDNLSILFKKLFNCSLLEKNLINTLSNYPVNIPISNPNNLYINDLPQNLDEQEVDLLFNAFSLLNFNNFSNHFIINQINNEITIYNNTNNLILVYGGERQEVLDHIIQFHTNDFIISPKIEIIEEFIEIKNQNLINILTYKMSLINNDELFSLANLIKYENEESKIKFLQHLNTITYNFSTNDSYDCIKSFVIVALSIKNKILLDQIITNNILFEVSPNEIVNIKDIVYFKNDFVLFGHNNEYKIAIKDIFLNNELSYFKCLETLINKLVEDQVSNHSNLLDLFNFTKVDGIQDIFEKLNRSLIKRNTSAYGSQLAFTLLYKQFN